MLRTLIILTRQRSMYKWLQLYHVRYLYKSMTINFNIHNTTQYCTSVKGRNKPVSKTKNLELEELAGINNVRTNITFRREVQQYNELGKTNDKLTSQVRISKDHVIYKRIEQLYPTPINSLISIYNIVGNEFNDKSVLTSSSNYIRESQLWEITYDVRWPETMYFKGIGKSKATASKNAALKCLHWLEKNSKLKNGKPILYNRQERENIQLKPVELNVTPDILNKMKDLIGTYNTKIKNIMAAKADSSSYNLLYLSTFGHPILGNKTYTNNHSRNEILRNRFEKRSNNMDLPIFQYRNEILAELRYNRVLLIEGDTGCGKTTQVPQFIMDSFIENGNATDCNILVSQPRRISAISLADRVAYEREENVGDVVGYQVKLEQILPKELGGILFCTTGILLKKLQSNPSLKRCSHVILDEAHERSIDTDLLMILLKRALKENSEIKLVIMSATINTYMFQQYFDCPVIKVPGRLYPVEMNFLEDIENLPDIQKYKTYKYHDDNDDESLTVDCEKIVQIIQWISEHKPHGAILCFLPGWYEITKVQNILENFPLINEKQLILPIHSKVSHDAQRKIFERTPVDTRKIILATDIAETGITVSDVSYVVDSAIRKELRWNNDKDIPSISNYWVSQANIHQRKGRAGRVKPGISYHLISKAEYKKLRPYPIAQILCNSLEKVVLDSKMYTTETAKDFLSCLLEPPSSTAIRKAVNYLVDLGVINEDESLTALGRRIVLFPIHPKFGKALVYSSIFNCIYPVITIVSAFSGEDNVFFGILSDKLKIRENKRLYHPSSDHIALSWIYRQWNSHNLKNPEELLKFCQQMKLRHKRMEILSQVRNIFVQQLMQCRLLPQNNVDVYNDCNNFDIMANKYHDNDELVQAILYSATQQLIEHKNIGFKNGILRKSANVLRIGRAKAVISGEGVNYKRKSWPSPYLTYFHSTHCDTRRSIVIRETSMISPLTVLLFNQREVRSDKKENGIVEITIDINKEHVLRFSCDEETADMLLQVKNIMWSIVEYLLEKQGLKKHTDYDSEQILKYKEQLLENIVEILDISSECIKNDDNSESST